jgi:hypothetical protein
MDRESKREGQGVKSVPVPSDGVLRLLELPVSRRRPLPSNSSRQKLRAASRPAARSLRQNERGGFLDFGRAHGLRKTPSVPGEKNGSREPFLKSA